MAPTMTTKRIQNCYYVVADVARSRAFYERVLELKIKFQDDSKWAQFDVGGANFSLSSIEEAASNASNAVIVFEVDSLDAVKPKIIENGGHVVSERDMGLHGRTLAFVDPDQNVIQLFERMVSQNRGDQEK